MVAFSWAKSWEGGAAFCALVVALLGRRRELGSLLLELLGQLDDLLLRRAVLHLDILDALDVLALLRVKAFLHMRARDLNAQGVQI